MHKHKGFKNLKKQMRMPEGIESVQNTLFKGTESMQSVSPDNKSH